MVLCFCSYLFIFNIVKSILILILEGIVCFMNKYSFIKEINFFIKFLEIVSFYIYIFFNIILCLSWFKGGGYGKEVCFFLIFRICFIFFEMIKERIVIIIK